jgi:hypothetical protein
MQQVTCQIYVYPTHLKLQLHVQYQPGPNIFTRSFTVISTTITTRRWLPPQHQDPPPRATAHRVETCHFKMARQQQRHHQAKQNNSAMMELQETMEQQERGKAKAPEMSNDVSWAIGKFFFTLASFFLSLIIFF